MVVPDTLSVRHAARIAELARMARLPSWHGFAEEVEKGGLISYGPNLIEPFRYAAAFVDKPCRASAQPIFLFSNRQSSNLLST